MTACSQEATHATNPRVPVGCCQPEVENPPLDRGRAWLPSTAQTPALPQASAKVTSLLLLAQSQAQARGALRGSNARLAAGKDVTAPNKLPESPAQGHLGSGSIRSGWDSSAWKGEW